MSANLSTPAFLLQSHDLGESDRILTFYTQHHGKIRGVARAAKKSRKRFGGALDWFHLVRLDYRNSRSPQNDLGRVESLDMIRQNGHIVEHLDCYALASYYLELIRELTSWQQADPMVFDLLHMGISRLQKFAEKAVLDSQSLEDLTRFFEINLLDLLGFRPVLDNCVHCRKDLQPKGAEKFRFCILRGGLVCKRCEKKSAAHCP